MRPRKMGAVRQARAGELFDLLVVNPEGLTIDQIIEELSVDKRTGDGTVRDLRVLLGNDDEINVIAVPQGAGQRWLYQLKGNLAGESAAYLNNRKEDALARFETIIAIVTSLAKAVDGRSTEGKRLAYIKKSLVRVREDLKDVTIESA